MIWSEPLIKPQWNQERSKPKEIQNFETWKSFCKLWCGNKMFPIRKCSEQWAAQINVTCNYLHSLLLSKGNEFSISYWRIYLNSGLVNKLCLTLATPWTIGCQAPLFMGFSRQEYWSGLLFPSGYKGIIPETSNQPYSSLKTITGAEKWKDWLTKLGPLAPLLFFNLVR